jgi:hypothetical protein
MGGITKLFGGGSSVSIPKASDPTPLADLQDPAILARKRRVTEESAARSGRASTVLTQNGDYSGNKLGIG